MVNFNINLTFFIQIKNNQNNSFVIFGGFFDRLASLRNTRGLENKLSSFSANPYYNKTTDLPYLNVKFRINKTN